MKKRIKNLVAFLCAVSLCVTSVINVNMFRFVEAASSSVTEVNTTSSLVAHWDFEGEGDAVWEDKATGGNVKDNLTVITSADTSNPCQAPTVANGVVAFEGKGGGLRAEDSPDLDITGEMTIYIRVNVWGSTGYDLLNKSSQTGTPGYLVHAGQDTTVLQLTHGENEPQIWRGDVMAKGENVWRELAFVVSRDETSGNLIMQGYQSKDATVQVGDDFVAMGDAVDLGASEQCTNDIPLTIGNTYELDQYADVWRYFDDIRIYNKEYTMEQLVNLLNGTTPDIPTDTPTDTPTELPPYYLENFKLITTSSFVNVDDSTIQMADTMRYENHYHYSMQSVQGNVIDSFDHTLLSMKVKFESEDMHSRIQIGGKNQSSAFMIYTDTGGERLVFSQTKWNGNRMAEDPFMTFIADKAGVTSFLNNEFLLQISFEYGNFDNGEIEDDVKLGFYFGGTLYEGAHKTIYNCNMDNFGNWLTVYCDQPNGGAPVTISSVVPTNLNLTELTWSDFQKAGNNTHGEDKIVPIMKDSDDIELYKLSDSSISNMENTSYESKLMFEKADVQDRVYYAGTSDWKGMIFHARSDGNLWLQSWQGVSPDLDVNETLGVVIFDKDIAGVGTFLKQEFKLKITTEFGNYDGDDDANDVQLGFYFNDKLYNNQYLYAYDCKDDFGNYITLHPGTGNMFIRSTTEEYEETIQHLWTDGAYDVGDIETDSILVNGAKPEEEDITIPGDYLITSDEESATKLVLYSEDEPHPDDSFDVRDLIATVKVCNGVALDTWSGTLGVYVAGMDANAVREKLLNRMDLEKSNAVSPEFIGGQDVMPIGGYCGPHRAYTDEGRGQTTLYPNFISDDYYKHISDAGVNLITYSEEDYVYSDGSNVKKMLELGIKYGVGHFVSDYDVTSRIGASGCSDVVISNGVAKIKDAATLRAVNSVDLNITGEMTIFMRVKMDKLLDNNGLLSKGPITGGAYSIGVFGDTNKEWWFSSRGYDWSENQPFPKTEWREMAAVVTFEDGNMKVSHYLAKDSNAGITRDCRVSTSTRANISKLTPNTYPLYIGNYLRDGLTSTTVTREYDDIRIYNKALTAEQLADIVPNQADTDETVKEALVAHWDFENNGTDGSELLDKATAGGVSDNLNVFDVNGTLCKQTDLTLASLQERIANYSSYVSFCGLYLVDEPTTEYYMPGSGMKNISNYQALASVLKNDLDLTYFANMFPVWNLDTNQEKYDQYVEEYYDTLKPKFLSWDYYPFESNEELDVYFYNMSLMREKAVKTQIPFWATIQAGGHWNDDSSNTDGNSYPGDRPTKGQFNWNVNTCLAFGVQGLTYFPLIQPLHFAYAPNGEYVFERNGMIGADGRLNDWYYYAKEINTHIKTIDKVLMNAVNKGVIVSGDDANTDTALINCVIESGQFRELQSVNGDAMIGCFKYQGKTALYVVNYNMESEQNITLTFNKECRVKMVQSAKTSFASTTELQLNMAAGEGALLVIE